MSAAGADQATFAGRYFVESPMTQGQSRLPAAMALVPVALLIMHQWLWQPDALSGDYAQYLAHALALLDGRPYGDIGYLYHEAAWDIGPPAYPPGFPLTLAPIIAVAGTGHLVLRLVSVGLALLSVIAFGQALPRDLPRWKAWLAGAMTLFAMEASGGLLVPLSDPGFCLLFWACLWTMRDAGTWTWQRIATLTVLGGLAMSYRVAGVVLVPVVVVSAALTWPSHRGRALWPAVIWIGGAALAFLSGRVELPYPQLINLVGDLDASDLWSGARFALFEILAYPFPGDLANDLYHVVAGGVVLFGSVVIVRTWSRHPAITGGLGYALFLLVSPIQEPRYYWPLFPALALCFIVGVHSLIGRRWPARAPTWSVAVVLLILCAALASRWRVPAPLSITGTPDGREMLAWVRRSATPTTRVAFRNPRMLTLQTGVPAMALGDRTEFGLLAMFDDRAITHVVVATAGRLECKDLILRELIALVPDRFTRVWGNGSYQVYELRPGSSVNRNAWQPVDWDQPPKYCA